MAPAPKRQPRWLTELDILVGGLVFPLAALAVIALLLFSLWL